MDIAKRENVATQNQREDEIDLLELFYIVRAKLHIVVFSTLFVGLLALLGSIILITPQYQASITMYVNNFSAENGASTLTQSDLNASMQLVDTYSAIISSKTVLEMVIDEAEVDLTTEELEKKIETEAINKTEVFVVNVLNSDPKEASRIANAIAEIAPEQIAEIVDGSSVKVVDYAKIPEEIETPNYLKNTLIGFILGLFFSVGIIILLDWMDTSIKTESDFERWNLPVLGVVPDLEESKRKKNRGYGYGVARATVKTEENQ